MANEFDYDPTRLELGGATLGGAYVDSVVTIQRACELLRTALDLGIRRFDIAPLYGQYYAETIFGRALDELGIDRNSLNINTKVARTIVPAVGEFASTQPPFWQLKKPFSLGIETWDLSYVGVLSCFYGSMTRIGAEVMDVAIHDPGDVVRETDQDYDAFDDTVRAIEHLKQAGYVRHAGMGSKTVEETLAMVQRYPGVFDYIQVTTYNLMIHSETLSDLIPLCKQKNIELRIAGPLGGNILAIDDPREVRASGKRILSNYQLANDEDIDRAGTMWDVAAEFGQDHLRCMAMQFVYGNPAVDRIVLGANDGDQLRQTVGYLSQKLPTELWAALKSQHLIDASAPTGD